MQVIKPDIFLLFPFLSSSRSFLSMIFYYLMIIFPLFKNASAILPEAISDGGLPPLILICCSPPTEVGVISHLIYILYQLSYFVISFVLFSNSFYALFLTFRIVFCNHPGLSLSKSASAHGFSWSAGNLSTYFPLILHNMANFLLKIYKKNISFCEICGTITVSMIF